MGILVAVLLATGVGFLFEYDANRKFDLLNTVNDDNAVIVATDHDYEKKLADAIGITAKGVEKQLAKLKAEGLIRRDGPDKGGEWIVLD